MRTANGDLVRVGAQLCIFGLESRVDLNNVLCTAVELDPAAGRVEVRLATGDSARVRPSNLRAPVRDESSLQQGDVAVWFTDKGIRLSDDPETRRQFVGAAYNGDIESLRWGLQHGLDVNTTDETGWMLVTPLMMAASGGQPEALDFLIEHDADLDLRIESRSSMATLNPEMSKITALAMAAKEGNAREVKTLIDAGADADLPAGNRLFTPLMMAVDQGHIEVVEVLVAADALQCNADAFGNTALMKAALRQDTRMLTILNDRTATDLANDQGFTALAQAAAACAVDNVAFLLSRGANVHIQSNNGETALTMAASSTKGSAETQLAVVEMLAHAGASLDIHCKHGSTALMFAAEDGRVELVKLLMRLGATLELRDEDGRTALARAQQVKPPNDKQQSIVLLIQAHASARAVSQAQSSQINRLSEIDASRFLEAGGAQKNLANELFRSGNFSNALAGYHACLALLPVKVDIQDIPVQKLVCAVQGNVAACHIKMAEDREQNLQPAARVAALQDAEEAANDALHAIDEALSICGVDCANFSGGPYAAWQMKPLYRRSKVHLRLRKSASSRQDLRDVIAHTRVQTKTTAHSAEELQAGQDLVAAATADLERQIRQDAKLLSVCSSPDMCVQQAASAILNGADPNVNANMYRTIGSPLFLACSCGHSAGAIPCVRGLHYALSSKWMDGDEVALAQMLLNAKADPALHVNTVGGDGSPLSRLAELGLAPSLVRVLVNAGADVEDRCGDENEGLFTPLIITAKMGIGLGHLKTLNEFIAAGAGTCVCARAQTQKLALV